MNTFPIEHVRREFPALSRTHDGRSRVYMDNPAGTQLPRRVVDAITGALVDAASNYGGFFENSRNAEAIYARAHDAMRDFVNARSSSEIVVAQSMTQSDLARVPVAGPALRPGGRDRRHPHGPRRQRVTVAAARRRPRPRRQVAAVQPRDLEDRARGPPGTARPQDPIAGSELREATSPVRSTTWPAWWRWHVRPGR